jgi:hypothetical protein
MTNTYVNNKKKSKKRRIYNSNYSRSIYTYFVCNFIATPSLSFQFQTNSSKYSSDGNTNNSHVSNGQIAVLSVDSKRYGLTYGEWTAKWWQWGYSIPKDINPAYDDTGKNCAQKQNGPVWFLAGTYGHAVNRGWDIPAGKAILFPILN